MSCNRFTRHVIEKMITNAPTFRALSLTMALLLLAGVANSQTRKRSRSATNSVTTKVPSSPASQQPESTSDFQNKHAALRLSDGTRIAVDDAWESQQGIWYKRNGVSYLVPRERVRAIERGTTVEPKAESQVPKLTVTNATAGVHNRPVWIYLVGGARLEADNADESGAGVWYRRGSLSLFIERSRIDRVEREEMESLAESESSSSKERGWSTGSAKIDALIKQNGAKYNVDPYLIFCVMEQESHFSTRSVSPKGARGLMQLMPGTSARFGVRHPFSPAENISAGTRYLKKLIEQFNGRVDLVLASYNAGEGTVIKYGSRVPPYKETRDYVKRISYRYRRAKAPVVRAANSAASSGGT